MALQAADVKFNIYYTSVPKGLKDVSLVSSNNDSITVSTGKEKITVKNQDLIKLELAQFQPLPEVERIVLVNGDLIVGKLVEGKEEGVTVKLGFESTAIGRITLDMSQHVRYHCNQPGFKNAEDYTRFYNRFIAKDGRNDKSDYVVLYEDLVPGRVL